MVIPVSVEQLHRADSALNHASCQQAVGGEGWLSCGGTVPGECILRFFVECQQFWNGGLHAEGEFILAGANCGFGVEGVTGAEIIEAAEGGQLSLSICRLDSGRVGEKQDWITLCAKLSALVNSGQETGGPQAGSGAAWRPAEEYDPGGEIVIFGAESPGEPGTESWPSAASEAGVQKHLRGGVIDFIGVDGANDGQFIGDSGQFRQEFGEDLSAVTVLSELPWGTGEHGCFADESEIAIAGDGFRAGLTVTADQFWFAVEQIELRGGTDHVQADEVFGFSREVGRRGCVGADAVAVCAGVQRVAERQTGAGCGCADMAASDCLGGVVVGV